MIAGALRPGCGTDERTGPARGSCVRRPCFFMAASLHGSAENKKYPAAKPGGSQAGETWEHGMRVALVRPAGCKGVSACRPQTGLLKIPHYLLRACLLFFIPVPYPFFYFLCFFPAASAHDIPDTRILMSVCDNLFRSSIGCLPLLFFEQLTDRISVLAKGVSCLHDRYEIFLDHPLREWLSLYKKDRCVDVADTAVFCAILTKKSPAQNRVGTRPAARPQSGRRLPAVQSGAAKLCRGCGSRHSFPGLSSEAPSASSAGASAVRARDRALSSPRRQRRVWVMAR